MAVCSPHQNMSLTLPGAQAARTSRPPTPCHLGQAKRLKGKGEAGDKQVCHFQASVSPEYENRLGHRASVQQNQNPLSLFQSLCPGWGGGGGGTVVGLVTQGSSMSCRDTEVGEKKIKLIGHSSQKFTPGEEVYGALERKDSKDISHRIIAGKEKSELTGEQ